MKHIYIDESGEPGERYFGLTAVAVADAQFVRLQLQSALSQLAKQPGLPGAERVLARGYLHCADDTRAVRQFFFHCLSRLSFHCKVAIHHYSAPPAATEYQSLVGQLFGEMLLPGRPTLQAEVVVALRDVQPRQTGRGHDYELLLHAVRTYFESAFPSLAPSLPRDVAVKHAHAREEPGLELPDYCGWAVRRRLVQDEDDWLNCLLGRDLEWHEVDKVAGQAVGVDFYCGGKRE